MNLREKHPGLPPDSMWRRKLGDLARVFLEAARYSDGEISMLGDLSSVSFEQVQALLIAKLEEAKLIERIIAENASDFKLLHDEKLKK